MTSIKQIVTKKVEVTTLILCDSCGKKDIPENCEDWYGFNSSHNGWGNDSVDSYRWYDVCSLDCYILQLETCLKRLQADKRYGLEIDGKPFIFVENLVKLLNINEYKKYTWGWHCRCGQTNNQDVLICECGEESTSYPLEKKEPQAIMKLMKEEDDN